ncbi:MAG: tol-pal system protein YbgF [Desulfobacteraceae bacterium]|nr:tol-pal system protein YbgF [Desulfobacteraceae bacterium]
MRQQINCWCILLLLTSVVFSCSSKDISNDTTGHPDSEQMANIEIRIADIKQTQKSLEEQIRNKQEIISNLENKIRTLEHKVQNLEGTKTNMGTDTVTANGTEPSQLYKKARNLLLEGNAIEAAEQFTAFVEKYPDNNLADNAMYWLGECHYSLGRYKKAIGVFKNLVKTYPKVEKVPDALLKTGYSYLSLDDSNRAHHYLKLVVKKYPFSESAEKAQTKLGTFK